MQVSVKSTTKSCIEFLYNQVLSEVVKVLFDFLWLSTATKIILFKKTQRLKCYLSKS